MENNTNNVNDKGKIMVLVSLIIAVSILLVAFVFVTVIDLTHKDAKSKISTTTRRTISTEQTTDIPEPPVTEPITEKPTNQTSETTTSPTTTRPRTTTTRRVEDTTKPTSGDDNHDDGGTVIPSHSYDIAYDSTTYPDAVDSWEWEIVNLINQERKRNGLSELYVARDLRNMAEEAAYMYYANGSSVIRPYLDGYAYLYGHSNSNIEPRTIFESLLNSTKITTNPDIKYVGSGVLVKNQGIDTYYYVIVYE